MYKYKTRQKISDNDEVGFYLVSKDGVNVNYLIEFKKEKRSNIIKTYHKGCYHCQTLTGEILNLSSKIEELIAFATYFSQIYDKQHIIYNNYSNKDFEEELARDISEGYIIETKCDMCNKIKKDHLMNHLIFSSEYFVVCEGCFTTFNLNSIQYIHQYGTNTICSLEDKYKKPLRWGLDHLKLIKDDK